MNGIEELPVEVIKHSPTVKKINKLLTWQKSKEAGLIALKQYLPYVTDENAIEHCVNWMEQCCKNDYSNSKLTIMSYEVLRQLIVLSSKFSELHKTVSLFLSSKFYDQFLKYLLQEEIGWLCAEACFTYYNGSCTQYINKIKAQIEAKISKDVKVSKTVARCYALIPQLGGSGSNNINYRNSWRNHYERCIDYCHAVLNNLYSDVMELQEHKTNAELPSSGSNSIPGYFCNQLYNYCAVLENMLLMKFPTVKEISIDLAMNLICRGLAVTPKTLGKQMTSDLIALRSALPEVHKILYSLLGALIVACKTALFPCAHLVCKLLKQGFQWTEIAANRDGERIYGSLRIAVYNTLCDWLVATKNGGLAETISKTVISAVKSDIQAKKKTVTLKTLKELKSPQKNDQFNRGIDINANGKLCYSALRTVELYLQYSGVVLKPEEHEILQRSVIDLLIEIHSCCSSADIPIPYALTKCRKELYSVLLSLVNNPCPKWPPPTQFALRLFDKGANDKNVQISQFCSSALSQIMNVIHPGFNVAVFPVAYESKLAVNDSENQTGNQRTVSLIWRKENNVGSVESIEPASTSSLERNTESQNDGLLSQDSLSPQSPLSKRSVQEKRKSPSKMETSPLKTTNRTHTSEGSDNDKSLQVTDSLSSQISLNEKSPQQKKPESPSKIETTPTKRRSSSRVALRSDKQDSDKISPANAFFASEQKPDDEDNSDIEMMETSSRKSTPSPNKRHSVPASPEVNSPKSQLVSKTPDKSTSKDRSSDEGIVPDNEPSLSPQGKRKSLAEDESAVEFPGEDNAAVKKPRTSGESSCGREIGNVVSPEKDKQTSSGSDSSEEYTCIPERYFNKENSDVEMISPEKSTPSPTKKDSVQFSPNLRSKTKESSSATTNDNSDLEILETSPRKSPSSPNKPESVSSSPKKTPSSVKKPSVQASPELISPSLKKTESSRYSPASITSPKERLNSESKKSVSREGTPNEGITKDVRVIVSKIETKKTPSPPSDSDSDAKRYNLRSKPSKSAKKEGEEVSTPSRSRRASKRLTRSSSSESGSLVSGLRNRKKDLEKDEDIIECFDESLNEND